MAVQPKSDIIGLGRHTHCRDATWILPALGLWANRLVPRAAAYQVAFHHANVLLERQRVGKAGRELSLEIRFSTTRILREQHHPRGLRVEPVHWARALVACRCKCINQALRPIVHNHSARFVDHQPAITLMQHEWRSLDTHRHEPLLLWRLQHQQARHESGGRQHGREEMRDGSSRSCRKWESRGT